MDLSGEAGSGTRILTARHISPDKSLPETNIAINSTLLCHSYSQNPDFATYYSGIFNSSIYQNVDLFANCAFVKLIIKVVIGITVSMKLPTPGIFYFFLSMEFTKLEPKRKIKCFVIEFLLQFVPLELPWSKCIIEIGVSSYPLSTLQESRI